jgi:hypothetical protein
LQARSKNFVAPEPISHFFMKGPTMQHRNTGQRRNGSRQQQGGQSGTRQSSYQQSYNPRQYGGGAGSQYDEFDDEGTARYGAQDFERGYEPAGYSNPSVRTSPGYQGEYQGNYPREPQGGYGGYGSYGGEGGYGGYGGNFSGQRNPGYRGQQFEEDGGFGGNYGSNYGGRSSPGLAGGYYGPRGYGGYGNYGRQQFGQYGGQSGYQGRGDVDWDAGDWQGGRSQQSQFDPDYSQWRSEQLRKFDDDYQNWRQERYGKFSDEFSEWRKNRQSTTGSNNENAGTSGSTGSPTATSRGNKS